MGSSKARGVVKVALGAGILWTAACSGKVQTKTESTSDACHVDTDCPVGPCVDGSCARPLADAGIDATIPVDPGTPPPVTDLCFSIPAGSCGNMDTPAPAANDGSWVVRRAQVLRGGDGFALELSAPPPAPGSGGRYRVVAIDRSGGCARFLSEEKNEAGISFGVASVGAGGNTLAAVVGCGGKFACGSELDRNGAKILDLDADLPLMAMGSFRRDLYGQWTHGLAVAASGAMLVVSGPRPIQSVAGPVQPDRLIERWVSPSGSVVKRNERPGADALVAIDVLPTGGAAVVLRSITNAGPGASRVQLEAEDFSLIAVWTAPPEVRLTDVSARGDWLALTGETSVNGLSRAWLGVLDAKAATLVWAMGPKPRRPRRRIRPSRARPSRARPPTSASRPMARCSSPQARS